MFSEISWALFASEIAPLSRLILRAADQLYRLLFQHAEAKYLWIKILRLHSVGTQKGFGFYWSSAKLEFSQGVE